MGIDGLLTFQAAFRCVQSLFIIRHVYCCFSVENIILLRLLHILKCALIRCDSIRNCTASRGKEKLTGSQLYLRHRTVTLTIDKIGDTIKEKRSEKKTD